MLETLRQPIETGEVVVARANAHIRYPCRFMLVAAANPCRCGHLADAARACARAPACGEDYMGRISGPLLDRFDLRVDVPPVAFQDLGLPASGESSAEVAARVDGGARGAGPRAMPGTRGCGSTPTPRGACWRRWRSPAPRGATCSSRVAERMGLSARGYHRVLRVARTVADLDGAERVRRPHVAEAVSYRLALAREV